MPYLILILLAMCGFLVSVVIHIMTFWGFDFIWASIYSLYGAFALAIPGIFIFPSSLPPYDRSLRAGYNFWRLIPQSWQKTLTIFVIYSVVVFVFTGLGGKGSIPPNGSRIASAMSFSLFLFHIVAYWYHSPSEHRERWNNFLHPKKEHKHHHSKHTQE
jgi:hypothetical protein